MSASSGPVVPPGGAGSGAGVSPPTSSSPPAVARVLSVPRRGEVWMVDLEPTRGSELRKKRPVIVMSVPGVGHATIRVCVPLTGWQPMHDGFAWCRRVLPDSNNGLMKVSTADTAQVRTLDITRFINKLGIIAPDTMVAVADRIAFVVGNTPPIPPLPAPAMSASASP